MADLKFVRSFSEAGNIKTFVFEVGDTKWQPGQYQEYVLPQAGESDDDSHRWFTVASAPSEHEVHISTRMSGSNFKNALDALKPGETIEARGAEGDFTWDDDSEVVLVAGGIGITPIRSMIVERSTTGKLLKAKLLYYGRDENFAFRELFDKVAAEHSEFSVEYIVGEPITADSIIAHEPRVKERTTYLTGAEPMVESVGNALKERGVELKQDWLPGYDEKTY
ncbi:MAG TPA: FAD-dependent oxidoreductase [Candidatus Saccharimonadaceae bacterium]|nr:FAD-dependent oxidoreductase [Candidatus Saccharimonadaceae bacterium]